MILAWGWGKTQAERQQLTPSSLTACKGC